MAALDFPASPVNGQVFAAPNGVTYIYSSTYTAWQAQPLSAGFVGDFMASSTAGNQVAPPGISSWFVIKPANIDAGNAGGWYNSTNGRYTPPKGRYRLHGEISFYSSSSNVQGQIKITKNGANIPTVGYDMVTNTPGANMWGMVSAEVIVDANGTDYFEFQSQCTVLFSQAWGRITAIPISPNANMVQGTGDFSAVNSAGFALGASTNTVVAPNTILSGNSGGWYNTSNGRFTPPAGRYFLFGTFSAAAPSGPSGFQIFFRKNGAAIGGYSWGTGASANWNEGATNAQTVDANGTDYFELVLLSGITSNVTSVQFMAFPISGIKGPQGDAPAGALMLVSEHVLAAPASDVRVTIPSNAKRIEIDFYATCVNATDSFQMQELLNGVPQTATNHVTHMQFGLAPANSYNSALQNTQPSWCNVGGSTLIWGRYNLMLTPAGALWGTVQMEFVQTGGSMGVYQATVWGGISNPTGFRIFCGAGNVAAGSFMRCWAAT